MIIVILAESFGYLSFAKIITLSRKASDAEREKVELRRDNEILRNNLINLATTVNQSQQTTNFNGISIPQLQALGVVPSEGTSEKEDEDKLPVSDSSLASEKSLDTTRVQLVQVGPAEKPAQSPQSQSTDWQKRHIYNEIFEEYLLFSFMNKYNMQTIDLQKGVQFGAGAESIDPIMDRRTVFDGFIRTSQKEYFIDVRQNRSFY